MIITDEARNLLAQEYMKGGKDGPYPSCAELALYGNGEFTLCSLRAIQKALDKNKEEGK